MKKHSQLHALEAAVLSASMAFTLVPAPAFASEKDEPSNDGKTKKTETVYAFVDEDGNLDKTVVSSWIHDKNGISGVKETLDLTNVENVKTDEDPVINGSQYTWNVKGNDVYYEGETDKQLPVALSITYELDGKKVKASELAGKSGHLKTTIHFKNNQSKTVDLNGKKVTIHPAYLAGGMLMFDHNVFSNIECSQGTVVNDGSQEMMMFAAVPGLPETLKQADLKDLSDQIDLSDDVVIESDIKDYASPDLYVALTNEFDLKDLTKIANVSELTSQLDPLFDAASQLNEGAGQLADGTGQLADGITPLVDGASKMDTLKDALVQLDQGAGSLQSGIAAYTDGAAKLADGTKQLDAITDGIDQLRAALGEDGDLKKGTSSLAAGLDQIQAGPRQMDPSVIASLDGQIAGYKTKLDGMEQMVQKDLAVLDQMEQSLNQMSALMDQKVQDAAAALQNAAGQLNQAAQGYNQLTAYNNGVAASLNEQAASANASLDAASASIDAAIASMQAVQSKDGVDLSAEIANLQAQKAALGHIGVQGGFQTYPELPASEMPSVDLSDLQAGIDQAKGAMSGLSADLSTAKSALDQISQEISAMKESSVFQGLSQSMNQLSAGISQAADGAHTLDAAISQKLEPAAAELESRSKEGIASLQAGADQLTANSAALRDGAAKLKDGTAQLSGQGPALSAMQAGITTLQDAVVRLNDGASQLHEGTEKFEEEGMKPLKEKVTLAADELENFEKAVDEIKDFTESFSSFAGAPENAETKVRYIYKTMDED